MGEGEGLEPPWEEAEKGEKRGRGRSSNSFLECLEF